MWLAANAGGQVRALAERGLDALLIVDEPALHLHEGARPLNNCAPLRAADAALAQHEGARPLHVWGPLRAVAPAWGLHLCGPVPWDVVERAEPDVLSFDLTLAPGDSRVLRRMQARGGRIAWGVLAPHRAGVQFSLPDADGAKSLLTPACGTGRMSLARELELAKALRSVRNGS